MCSGNDKINYFICSRGWEGEQLAENPFYRDVQNIASTILLRVHIITSIKCMRG